MNRVKTLLFSALLVLLLALSACGGGKEEGFDPTAATQALLDSGAYSETLEQLDSDIAFQMFGFSAWGEDPAVIEGSVVYYSTGATSECAAVILADQEVLDQVEESLQAWLSDQQAALADYQPQELPKLEGAILERRGNTVLLAVANDRQAAQAALDGLT